MAVARRIDHEAERPGPSGLVDGVDDLAPVVNHVLEVFGPDRAMFGGDWPVCLLGVEKYADWANSLKTIVKDRPDEQQKKLAGRLRAWRRTLRRWWKC